MIKSNKNKLRELLSDLSIISQNLIEHGDKSSTSSSVNGKSVREVGIKSIQFLELKETIDDVLRAIRVLVNSINTLNQFQKDVLKTHSIGVQSAFDEFFNNFNRKRMFLGVVFIMPYNTYLNLIKSAYNEINVFKENTALNE